MAQIMDPKSSHAFSFDRHRVQGSNSLVRARGPPELEKGGTSFCDCSDDWILRRGPLNGFIGPGDCVRSKLFPCCGIDRTDSEGVDDQ
jgi:hypothetical protein